MEALSKQIFAASNMTVTGFRQIALRNQADAQERARQSFTLCQTLSDLEKDITL